MKRVWGREVLIAVDQLANAILSGYADETISARSYRLGRRDSDASLWGRWRISWVMIDVLFYWQDAYLRVSTGRWPVKWHCERAYDQEVNRLQLPPEYRV